MTTSQLVQRVKCTCDGVDGVEESLALSFFPSLTKKCMLEQGRPICGHLSPEILVTENNKREKTGTNLGMKYKYKVVQI